MLPNKACSLWDERILPQLGFPHKIRFQVLRSQSFRQDSLLFVIDEAVSQHLIYSSFIPCGHNCLPVQSFTSCPLVWNTPRDGAPWSKGRLCCSAWKAFLHLSLLSRGSGKPLLVSPCRCYEPQREKGVTFFPFLCWVKVAPLQEHRVVRSPTCGWSWLR